MRLARRFLRLDRAGRQLALRAALLMGAISVGLSLLPLRVVRRLLTVRSTHPPGLGILAPEDVARAVTRASAVVPRCTCLVQALALHALLERRGCPAELRMGFERMGSGSLTGHAWVEAGGKAFGGPDDPFRYAPVAGLRRNGV